jgi:ASC-1-like (ASCH) protein
MSRMFFKQKYLQYILDGKKTLEGRIGYDHICRFRIGDIVYLNGEYKAQIIEVKKYSTFKDAINENNFKLLIPDANSIDDALNCYEKLFPLWKQQKYGVYVFTIKYPIKSSERQSTI